MDISIHSLQDVYDTYCECKRSRHDFGKTSSESRHSLQDVYDTSSESKRSRHDFDKTSFSRTRRDVMRVTPSFEFVCSALLFRPCRGVHTPAHKSSGGFRKADQLIMDPESFVSRTLLQQFSQYGTSPAMTQALQSLLFLPYFLLAIQLTCKYRSRNLVRKWCGCVIPCTILSSASRFQQRQRAARVTGHCW